ncbi:MAG: 2,3-bisphosphoglycerate-independent phosphoglycerate mutase, partial [Chlorobi bacterium]|nr:2,3-bisphosphoglycerate-independent phosphoglycerate mutase [Chlorobiota bacterium]
PVPVILVSNRIRPRLKNGILANVAPTLLRLMDLPVPEGMAESLIEGAEESENSEKE